MEPGKPYPTDVGDEEWGFVAPYLTLFPLDTGQRRYDLREVFNDLRCLLRLAEGRSPDPSAAILDSRTVQSTPSSGARAGYDGAKRKRGSKVHLAVDTLGHLLALPSSTVRGQKRRFLANGPRSHAGFRAIFKKVV